MRSGWPAADSAYQRTAAGCRNLRDSLRRPPTAGKHVGMAEMPQSGEMAPDFTLPVSPDESVNLSALRGRPVVLAFYPADFSPVCSDQMALYQAVKPEFDRYDAVLLGVSVDGVWCHRAFADSRKLEFAL